MWVLLGIVIFAIGFAIWFSRAIIKLIQDICKLIAALVYYFYDKFVVIRKYKKTTRYQDRMREQLQNQVNTQRKEEDFRRTQVLGAMNFVSKLRMNYPCADEHIFNEALDQLPRSTSRMSLHDYENLAKKSHFLNLEKRKPIQKENKKMYSLKDVESLTPIEIRTEIPITLSLYKIGEEYVLWVNNSSNNENSLFQTTNYTLILKYMLEVVNLQKNLHNAKVSVVARQLEDMFNNHVSSIDSILSARRNNLLG